MDASYSMLPKTIVKTLQLPESREADIFIPSVLSSHTNIHKHSMYRIRNNSSEFLTLCCRTALFASEPISLNPHPWDNVLHPGKPGKQDQASDEVDLCSS